MKLREAFDRYHRSHEHKATTLKDYYSALSHWERVTDDPDVECVTNLTCRDFKEGMFASLAPKSGLPMKPATIAKYCRELQSIFCKLGPCTMKNKQGLDIIPTIPCFPPIKVTDPLVVTADDDEIAAILKACEVAVWPKTVIDHKSSRIIAFTPSEWWLNLTMYLCTFGSRRNEFLALKSADVDCVKKQLTLDPEKNGAQNYKPIPHDLIPYFLGFLQPQREFFFAAPRAGKSLYKQWHLIQEAAGIHVRRPEGSRRTTYFGFHELRKTCGTNWAAVCPAAGKHMLGHRSQQVFDRFYTNNSKVARRVMENFSSPAALLTGTSDSRPIPPARPALKLFD